MLKKLINNLSHIPHLKRIRIHTRTPIVLPNRVTDDLIDAITTEKLQTVVVLHTNHAQEINDEIKTCVRKLKAAGITVLNQSVLLTGVNDSVDALVELSEALFESGIQPYYLHALDKVRGAAHFDMDREKAIKLHWEVAQKISGYLVPKLVCQQPGAPAKLPLGIMELCTD